MKHIILILLLAIIGNSCEKTVSIDIPDNGRKLTVNSFFATDSNLFISLTKSKYILDGEFEFESVENVDISFFENDQLIEKLNEINPGSYKSNYILKENHTYRIELTSENFPLATSESLIPERTEISSFLVYPTLDEYGYKVNGFKLKFQDHLNEENYYFIKVYRNQKFTYYDEYTDTEITGEFMEPEYLYSDDPNIFQEEWGLTEGLLMSGEFINGREYTLLFSGYTGYYYDEFEAGMNNSMTFHLEFCTVSKDFYLYYKSLSKHREATDDFFMEPVQVYNNIENGFGIFAGYSIAKDSVMFYLPD
ncbi:MAG: hypothetical protein DRJ10_10320 [Bacteroidetes bacterium]|nr:MAG: hypothetical protein DRJ10_10320 [Bacteroidota bacterium]